MIEKFKNAFNGFLNIKTLNNYLLILKQIENKTLIIKSKSKHAQVKSLISKCKEVGIELNYALPKWTKRGDNNIKKNRIDKLIDKDGLQTILNACPLTKKGKELQFAMQISYYSGLRCSEVLALKQSDIKAHKLLIQGKGSKFRKAYLPLNFDLSSFKGFTIDLNYVDITCYRIAKKLKINFSFHALRHSFASNMLNNGVNIYKVSQLLGHSDIKTTIIYLHRVDSVDEDMVKLGY